ncbi:MAG: hypothetical protein U0M66_02920 [Bacilli bacterium]|nr:hypothetical protein [Bacilli bacterium]
MNIVILIFVTAFLNSVVCYVDKSIMNKGVTKKEYFYYTCLTMLPFAISMIIFKTITGSLKFSVGIVPLLLLALAMFLRYKKQFAIAGMSRALKPFENVCYMSLGLLLAYLVDLLIGLKHFNLVAVSSIIITLIGVFTLAGVKLKLKSLRRDLIVRITCEIGLGYVAHFILSYWSNELYILFNNLLLVILCKQKSSNKKTDKKTIGMFFVQQLFGFGYIYLYNYLSSFSVTTSSFVKPVTILVTVIISFFMGKKAMPTIKNLIAILMIIIGVILINLC